MLDALRRAGPSGLTNSHLAGIALRYSSRLRELRVAGYEIETRRLGDGLFAYYLRGEPVAQVRVKAYAPKPEIPTRNPFTPSLFGGHDGQEDR